jgi:glycosyltransferase involved in cell wall biosynthesis
MAGSPAVRILAICQDYPNPRAKDITGFVHTRNICYRRLGHHVDVLSFAARASYAWDGISVLCERDLSAETIASYDVCVFHAPNLRNAMRLLFVYRKSFRRVCLVIHGHEFLNWYTYLPKPFVFDRTPLKRLKRMIQKYYDRVKLRVWAWFFKRLRESTFGVIFVSQWMKEHAERGMKIRFDDLKLKSAIIHNPINPVFVESVYRPPAAPRADFVTVRSFDNPKYAVDLVVEIARLNPQYTFHLYGQGRYFDYLPAPPNLSVFKEKFKQPDLPPLFSKYRCGLLPTRQDTQGVLMCEMAAFGMPLLTSDLDICKEMVGSFKNVGFISNETLSRKLEIPPPNETPDASKFSLANTVEKEVEFWKALPHLEAIF